MPAAFRLDHVVIRVYDLNAASAEYTALGFHVVPGGEHPGQGSRNALIAFADDSYLELIAYGSAAPERVVPRHVRQAELAGRSPIERHTLPWASAAEGLVSFALSPSSIEEALAEAARRGLSLDGPIPGGRLRPDGQRVAWQLGIPHSLDLPFLCADVTPRSLRVPGEEARKHRNGIEGISAVTVAVRDLAESVLRYEALLGQEPKREAETAVFVLGQTRIILAQPSTQDAWLQEWLTTRGEGPCALEFSPRAAARGLERHPLTR
jgi:catechol 2,3-dioxygenase-like lactoylglutathione lyase family enzyme